MPWKRMLAYITGSVNEDLLEENRVLRHQIDKRILQSDPERRTLTEKAVALGKRMADTVTRFARIGASWHNTELHSLWQNACVDDG